MSKKPIRWQLIQHSWTLGHIIRWAVLPADRYTIFNFVWMSRAAWWYYEPPAPIWYPVGWQRTHE